MLRGTYVNTKALKDAIPLPLKNVYVEMVKRVVESAAANAEDAKRVWLEAALEDGITIQGTR